MTIKLLTNNRIFFNMPAIGEKKLISQAGVFQASPDKKIS